MDRKIRTEKVATATFASAAPHPRADGRRGPGVPMALVAAAAVVCGVALSSLGADAFPFSPPHRRAPAARVRATGNGIVSPVPKTKTNRETRLAYKRSDDGGVAPEWHDARAGNETTPENGADADADVAAEIRGGEEDVVSPGGFVSPTRSFKKVPGVDPIRTSSVFLLGLIGGRRRPDRRGPAPRKETERWRPAIDDRKTAMGGRNRPAAFVATSYLESLGADADSRKDGSDRTGDQEADDLLKSLGDQRAQLLREQQQSRQAAMYAAARRTNPREAIQRRIEGGERQRREAERERLEKSYVEPKERLDAGTRDERRYSEEREGPAEGRREVPEGKAWERSEASAIAPGGGGDVREKEEEAPPLELAGGNSGRSVPVLDRSFVDAPPLLIGSTLAVPYSELTPSQRRALDLALERHREYCEKMEVGGNGPGGKGGIRAAPVIAVVDGYTAATMESSTQQQQSAPSKRYATLASIEIVQSSDNAKEPSAIKLTGVGRVFLRDYFSSKGVGTAREEEELSEPLAVHQFDREDFESVEENDTIADHEDKDPYEEAELPVVMAEFGLLLDDSSVALSSEPFAKYGNNVTESRASSMHAIAELHQCANEAYRLHEERKKLVAGLRAGEARLRLGRCRASVALAASAGGEEHCSVEFEDCDGLGGLLVGSGVIDDNKFQEEMPMPSASSSDAPQSRLETLENYGLGTYGALSTIPDLTTQLLVRLEPFYSPARREREEYEAEVASFVVLKSLEVYAAPDELARALAVPTSTTRRLELGHDIMMRHRDELTGLAERMSQKLMECGEECKGEW